MLRTNAHPAAMLAFAAVDVLRNIPSLCRRTWWTPETIHELRAAEASALDLEDFGLFLCALSSRSRACGIPCTFDDVVIA